MRRVHGGDGSRRNVSDLGPIDRSTVLRQRLASIIPSTNTPRLSQATAEVARGFSCCVERRIVACTQRITRDEDMPKPSQSQ